MPRPASDLEPRIVEAARGRFLREGVDGASLRGIAHDAGTSIGMVYYYFRTKDDLFLAVVEDVYAKVLKGLAAALEQPASAQERVEQLYQRIAQLDQREFDVVRLMLREALVSSTRLGKLAERFVRGHIPLLLKAASDAVTTHELRDDVPSPLLIACTAAVGMLPQIAHRLIADAGLPLAALLPGRTQLAELAAKVVLDGIRARQPAEAPGRVKTPGSHQKRSKAR